jgi:hypothetical protein
MGPVPAGRTGLPGAILAGAILPDFIMAGAIMAGAIMAGARLARLVILGAGNAGWRPVAGRCSLAR